MITSFKEAIRYLYSFVSYEHKSDWGYSDKTLNLQRYRGLLEVLGHPQNEIAAIHVAGSDGKGSTCAMLSSTLQSLGFKTGTYLSPHLENIRERICINDCWISEEEFTVWTHFIYQTLETMPPMPEGYATFFELLTTMAFLHFKKQKVDFAIIETGMGGRLDATNVMRDPLVTIITHISLEHTERLGNTLAEIADEKLGITRPHVPVVIGHQEESLYPHFKERLKEHRAPVIFTDESYFIRKHERNHYYRSVTIAHEPYTERTVNIPLFGYYQLQNVRNTLATLDLLRERDIIGEFDSYQLDEGFKNTYWPGRFEIIWRNNQAAVVLDVAHTVKGAWSLRNSLDEIFPKRKCYFLMGFLYGKKVIEMLNHLAREGDHFLFTKAPSPRGMPIEQIRSEIDGWTHPVEARMEEEFPANALQRALQLAGLEDVIVVTGSLYLVGELRQIVKEL